MLKKLVAVALMLGMTVGAYAQTAVWGAEPQAVYTQKHMGLTNTLATVSLPAMPEGIYRISFIQYVTTVGSAGSCQGTVNWQTEGGNAGGNIGGSLNLTITTVPREQTMVLRNKQGGIMSYASSCSGITGNPVYNLHVYVERIQ